MTPRDYHDFTPADEEETLDFETVLPYTDAETGYSSGWSGSEASAARAHHEDSTGITSERQRLTLRALYGSPRSGMTWAELANLLDWHHGQASGVLSNLHKAGRIARLRERRNGSSVYVLPMYVDGRETVPQGRPRPTDQEDAFLYAVGSVADWLETKVIDNATSGEHGLIMETIYRGSTRDLIKEIRAGSYREQK